MEILERPGTLNDHRPANERSTSDDPARDAALIELRAAIALVASHPGYRVLVCGMATDACLVAGLDERAAAAGVVLERRIRPGGGLDVAVRSA